MTFERAMAIALVLAIAAQIAGTIRVVKVRNSSQKRLELAKKNHWCAQAKMVRQKVINTARGDDWERNITRREHLYTYEYEVGQVKKRVNFRSRNEMDYEITIYYDPRKDYEMIDLYQDKTVNFHTFFPIAVFFGTLLFLKILFKL